MTEIIRMQSQLQQVLTRRFERQSVLLFSDVVGSTPYFARFGDAAGRQLQQLHFDLLAQAIASFGGRIVDTAGDGAFMVFAGVNAALDAVRQIQELVSHENLSRARVQQLQLRMGLHWGPVLTDGVSVSGDSVNFCARVASSAAAGEIRLTRETFLEMDSARRVQCQPVTTGELKGVSRAVELFALNWRETEQFPTHFRINESVEAIALPLLDIISFGRLRDHEGMQANDVVLATQDPAAVRLISRWHFELRRGAAGFFLRAISDSLTEVDGVPAPKGQDVPILVGSRVGVANALTLEFLAPRQMDARTQLSVARPR
ncbi:adenylate/guanylate cyclase domain-containing protein [Paucibacter sp. B2R-40]|uniref:adenylate/guanylate cyclase domain-containing protein n=1 Tax=Paucibacter sp. B2R-40 TaxID=2893554 RepID=UPI0021E43CD8|nr:adenylate/guanylate cyclase domain-containing protein [Paucibacter sp. B2R-40]MCV2355937.1 adenylate/guanylate cyclase domain-containing protein [Paucibacter sp. B2R-40]